MYSIAQNNALTAAARLGLFCLTVAVLSSAPALAQKALPVQLRSESTQLRSLRTDPSQGLSNAIGPSAGAGIIKLQNLLGRFIVSEVRRRDTASAWRSPSELAGLLNRDLTLAIGVSNMQPGLAAGNDLGAVAPIRVAGGHGSGVLIVTAAVGLPCGETQALYGFRVGENLRASTSPAPRQRRQPLPRPGVSSTAASDLIFVHRARRIEGEEDGIEEAEVATLPRHQGRRRLAVVSMHAACTSIWNTLTVAVFETGPDPYRPKLIWNRSFLAESEIPPPSFSLKAAGETLELSFMGHNALGWIRRHVVLNAENGKICQRSEPPSPPCGRRSQVEGREIPPGWEGRLPRGGEEPGIGGLTFSLENVPATQR